MKGTVEPSMQLLIRNWVRDIEVIIFMVTFIMASVLVYMIL